jgi:hypothetical protein
MGLNSTDRLLKSRPQQLTDPINNGSLSLPEESTLPTAETSMGSPTAVPVTWHSEYPVEFVVNMIKPRLERVRVPV